MLDETILKQFGFEGFDEFSHLIGLVDISNEENKKRFKDWKNHYGTKGALLELIKVNNDNANDIII